jgi:hypothetical protein
LGELKTQVAGVKQEVTRVASLVDKHEAEHNKATGVVWAMRSAWAVAGAGVLTGTAWIFRTLGIA